MYQDTDFSTFSGGGVPSAQSGITWGSRLATGFDRLKVGLYVIWENPLFFERLQDHKLASKEANSEVSFSFAPSPDLEHGDLVYNMHATGRSGGFAFHVSRGDVSIFFSTRKDIKTPNIWVDIGSESCWSPGWRQVLEDIKEIVELHHGRIWKNNVSEVHLCADFIDLSIQRVPIHSYDNWVTRAHLFNAYSDHSGPLGVTLAQDQGELPGEAMTGVIFGKGDIMLRIYNKVAELRRSLPKQGVFASVWGVSVFDQHPVTRVEYQLRRPVLMQMKIDTIQDLEAKRNSAWLYCTQEWSRLSAHTVDRVNRHQDTVFVHPWWQSVQQAGISLSAEPVKREYPRACKDINKLMEMVLGCLMSIGTILNCKSDQHEDVIKYGQMLIDKRFQQMWENKDEHGRREFEEKMKKRWAAIWPMGFEAPPG